MEVKPGSSIEEEQEVYRRIMKIYQELTEEGAEFSTVARRVSETNTGMYGGYLGKISPGQRHQEFERVAFSMTPGAISLPVRTEKGFNIIKVFGKGERDFPSFQDMQLELKEQLFTIRQEEILERTIAKLIKEQDVRIMLPGIDLERESIETTTCSVLSQT